MLAKGKVKKNWYRKSECFELSTPNKLHDKSSSQVELRADSLYLPLLKFAREGNRLISSSGNLEFSCAPSKPIVPVAFTSSEAYLVSYRYELNVQEFHFVCNGHCMIDRSRWVPK
jgi:hypothetical protein